MRCSRRVSTGHKQSPKVQTAVSGLAEGCAVKAVFRACTRDVRYEVAL